MTCKVQSMTLYVWEKSGYFTCFHSNNISLYLWLWILYTNTVYCILYVIYVCCVFVSSLQHVFALEWSCSRLFNSFLWCQSPYSRQAHTVAMTEVYSLLFGVATYSTRRRAKRDETCQLMTYAPLLSSPSIWGVLSLAVILKGSMWGSESAHPKEGH